MYMEMVDALASMDSVVNHDTIAMVKAFLFGYFSHNRHHVSEHLLVLVLCFLNHDQAISVFWYNQKVCLCNWGDVSESQAVLVFVDHISWDGLIYDFVEYRSFFLSG